MTRQTEAIAEKQFSTSTHTTTAEQGNYVYYTCKTVVIEKKIYTHFVDRYRQGGVQGQGLFEKPGQRRTKGLVSRAGAL